MPNDPYVGLEPTPLWQHFAALNAIPRPSGHEEAAREYVRQVAEAAGSASATDSRGNLIARVEATDGFDGPTVAIQSHLDMVCESADGVEHDCEHDPIVPRRDGDWILASGTTLGADNGIGVAAALSLLSDPATAHGPLELVFTVEEETGLHGAAELDVSMLNAQALINLDSEDDRALTVGCAGGADVELALPLAREAAPPGWHGVELRVSGLSGGHSGMQIHERHANAIVLAATVLDRLAREGVDFRLQSIDGGSAHNAIPRNASARLAVAGETAERAIAEAFAELRSAWTAAEPEIELMLLDGATVSDVLPTATAAVLVRLLLELPHGVIAMSERFEGTVETSANLATVHTEVEQARVSTSVRSLKEDELRETRERIKAMALAAGAAAELGSGYPGWEPRESSPLLASTVAAYREVYGRDPSIEVLHGGLECGVIVSKKPELDAVSFGPLIQSAHSPDERLEASTVVGFYSVLTKLLAKLGRPDA